MADTTKRSLPLMAGTDQAATIDDTYDAALTILDDASFYLADSFANRPSAADAVEGTFFKPTDPGLEGFLYLSDGVSWIEVTPGMGTVPIGASLDWWGANDPGDTRFVRMDGRALSQTTYATLYALIGDTYNTFRGAAAPNPGLFRIPNVAGLTTVGAGAGNGLTSRTLGASGGEENHTLTASEMPSHRHRILWRNLVYGLNQRIGGLSPATFGNYPNGPGATEQFIDAVNSELSGANTGRNYIENTGGNAAHNNMQPFVVANRIMRIA